VKGAIAIFQSPMRLKNLEKQEPRLLFFASEEFSHVFFRVSLGCQMQRVAMME